MTDSIFEQSTNRKQNSAPRGATLSCKGWQQEGALRTFMNSFDPEVVGTVACQTEDSATSESGDYEAINYAPVIDSLRDLPNGATLVIGPGSEMEVRETKEIAPGVIVNDPSLARTWMNIGTQQHLHIAYKLYAAAARKHFAGELAGKLIVSGGMGLRSGLMPLAATMNGAAFLGIEVNPERLKRCVKAGYCDVMVNELDEALRIVKNAVRKGKSASVGLIGNCADISRAG